MKRIFLLLLLVSGVGIYFVSAQETKAKPVTTTSDKVHNVTHPHHKISHGTKYKHKSAYHKKHVVTRKTENAEALKPKRKTEKER